MDWSIQQSGWNCNIFLCSKADREARRLWLTCAHLCCKRYRSETRPAQTAGGRDVNPPPRLLSCSCVMALSAPPISVTLIWHFLENNLSCARVLFFRGKPQGSCSNKPPKALFCTTLYQEDETPGSALQQKYGLSLETEPETCELERSWLGGEGRGSAVSPVMAIWISHCPVLSCRVLPDNIIIIF